MKFSLSNVNFSIAPITLKGNDSNSAKAEDVNIELGSDGASFSIERMDIEASIAELTELCGNKVKAVAPTTDTLAAPKADELN